MHPLAVTALTTTIGAATGTYIRRRRENNLPLKMRRDLPPIGIGAGITFAASSAIITAINPPAIIIPFTISGVIAYLMASQNQRRVVAKIINIATTILPFAFLRGLVYLKVTQNQSHKQPSTSSNNNDSSSQKGNIDDQVKKREEKEREINKGKAKRVVISILIDIIILLQKKQAEEKKKQAEEKKRQAEEKKKQAEEKKKQAEEKKRQAEEKKRQAEEKKRQYTTPPQSKRKPAKIQKNVIDLQQALNAFGAQETADEILDKIFPQGTSRADFETVKSKAFRCLARDYHSDKNRDKPEKADAVLRSLVNLKDITYDEWHNSHF